MNSHLIQSGACEIKLLNLAVFRLQRENSGLLGLVSGLQSSKSVLEESRGCSILIKPSPLSFD